MTFNTEGLYNIETSLPCGVLNLVINGWASIQGTLEVKLLDNAIMF